MKKTKQYFSTLNSLLRRPAGQFSIQKGFTLLEILLVVAAISILASIVIIAINPNKQLGDTRNSQRKTDINTILNAVYQYSLDNNGSLPAAIISGSCATANTAAEICRSGGTCTGLTDLSAVTTNERYLVNVPIDPSETDVNQTGYFVVRSGTNRVTVCAPNAESGATITATR